jgi:demethylspheroidene O-methyltransferase
MADVTQPVAGAGPLRNRPNWFLRLVMSRKFQSIATRTPVLRRFVRTEGAALFDVVQGFVQSQVLLALVELDILQTLSLGPASARTLGAAARMGEDRMALLLQAGAGLGLIRRRSDGTFSLSMRGAAFLGVPGLSGMVRHHSVLYRDLADPVAFLRGQTEPELARFWPYVFGAATADDPAVAATYSSLMSDSQALVAEDTLSLVNFAGVRRLLDVGGGTGAFLTAVGARHPDIALELFDLPAVMLGAQSRLGAAGLSSRVTLHQGSFRDDSLPAGADAISLIRVLYDHADATVSALLAKVHAALPPGGRIIVSEPMSGGSRPDPSTDVYFAIYTAAMKTGRTRSAAEISELLVRAGFSDVVSRPGMRPFITSVVTARRD